MKLIVIGYSGAGKTTLTTEIGKRCQCAVLHIDEIEFTKEYDIRNKQESLLLIEEIIGGQKRWIIDGYREGYIKEDYLKEADQIVFLDLNRWRCYWNISKRTWKRWKQDHMKCYSAATMQPASVYELDSPKTGEQSKTENSKSIWTLKKILRSLGWVWKERSLSHYEELGKRYPGKLLVLHNPRQVSQFKERICVLNKT